MRTVKQKAGERKLLVVHWGDAWSRNGWLLVSDAKKDISPAPVVTVGWLIHQDEHGVLLMASHDGNGHDGAPCGSNRSYIPRGMIFKIEVIRGHALQVVS